MTARTVELKGGSPWGFRMHGGADTNQPLRISRRYSASLERILDVNPGRKASLSGIREGDVISSINNVSTKHMTNAQAHSMLKNAGDTLKLGLNEDLGSPRRKGSFKMNATELKRPSQIIAEVQTQPKSETNNIDVQQAKMDISPSGSQKSHLSTISMTLEAHSPKTSPSKVNSDNNNLSSVFYHTTSAPKSPVRDPKTLIDPLKSPSLLTSPSRQRSTSQSSTSSFTPLESTSLVRSSIQPSITMPTITPPTFSYPNNSTPNLSNSDRFNPIYNSAQINTETSYTYQPSSAKISTSYLPISTANSLNPSSKCSPSYNTEIPRLSPKSPTRSIGPLSPNLSHKSISPQSSNQYSQSNSIQQTQTSSTAVPQSNAHNTYQIYPPVSDQSSVSCSPYFPFNTNSSVSNNIFNITTCSPYLSTAKPITSNSTHLRQNNNSPFGATPNSLPPVVSHTAATPKTSLSSIQLPHYLLYSTPTTTKSTNPFITKEYLMTKTEISEESINETQEITTTKKLFLNGYEEPSASAFDKALSSLRINGPNFAAETAQRSTSPHLDGLATSPGASLSSLGGSKPVKSPQELNPKSEQQIPTSEDSKPLSTRWNPRPLRELCVHKVVVLPYGRTILEELAAVSKSLKFLTRDILNDVMCDVNKTNGDISMLSQVVPDVSAVKNIVMTQNQSNESVSVNIINKTPPPVAPRKSSFKSLKDDWVGLPSQKDPTLLACLSPAQRDQLDRTKNIGNNDEAGELIDMHRKYFERRGYDETHANSIKSVVSNNKDDKTPMQTSGGDATVPTTNSTNRLLAIIRDPQVNPDATVQCNDGYQSPTKSTFDFMETLRSFESLNKKMEEENLKSYHTKKNITKENFDVKETYTSNQSIKANIKKSDVVNEKCDNTNKINSNSFIPIDFPSNSSHKEYSFSKEVNKDLMNGGFQSVTINKSYHSTGNVNSMDSEKSSSFVKLSKSKPFILDDAIFDLGFDRLKSPSNSTPPFQNFGRRSSLPKDLHDNQFEYIVEKEKEIEEHIRQLEERRRNNMKRSGPKAPMLPDSDDNSYVNLPVPKYHISRQRDIATIQSDVKKSASNLNSERSNSMTSLPSNAERFRDQMYFEYMDKFAEREERKQHKVIKISSSNGDLSAKDNVNVDTVLNDAKKNCNKIEEEFINKAKLRWSKLGIADPETEDESESVKNDKNNKDKDIATEKKPVVIEHKIKVLEGDEEKDVQKLPSHLQEFVKFTSNGEEAGESHRHPDKSDTSLFAMFVVMAVIVLAIGRCLICAPHKKLTN